MSFEFQSYTDFCAIHLVQTLNGIALILQFCVAVNSRLHFLLKVNFREHLTRINHIIGDSYGDSAGKGYAHSKAAGIPFRVAEEYILLNFSGLEVNNLIHGNLNVRAECSICREDES